jgi:hypothetical protein
MQQLLGRHGSGERLGEAAGDVAELAARAQLRTQIGRLERQLSVLFTDAFPFVELEPPPVAAATPRLLDLGGLELARDQLADRVAVARETIAARRAVEALNRGRLTALLEAPERHRGLVITRTEVGEPGCGGWASAPRLGPLGRLMGWWRVKVSSGCPLAGRLTAVEREEPQARRPAAAQAARGHRGGDAERRARR